MINEENFLTKNTISNFSEWLENVAASGGFALIDKDRDWTSFDVVAKMRGITHIKKIGHCGTLDPLATGLLILALGKATKEINNFQDLGKKYSAVLKLGATTKSFDSEFPEENIKDFSQITLNEIIKVTSSFIGEISQKPPIFSAKKVNGKRLYKYARAEKEIEIQPVIVNVQNIIINKIDLPFIHLEIDCSKGTYIRSIADEIGEKLGCGAYLFDLRRTGIGQYSVDDAVGINQLSSYRQSIQ